MVTRTLLIIIICLLTSSGFSQDTTKAKKLKVLPVPALGYSPETNFYFGAVSLFSIDLYDSLTRSSTAKLEFNYTLNKQSILEGGWTYFFKDESWLTQGLVHYSRYPDLYYGIGTNTPDSNETVFNANRFNTDVNILKSVGKQLFIGPQLKYVQYSNLSAKFPDSTSFTELNEATLTSFGFTMVKDVRNSILTPVRGYYLSLKPMFNLSDENYFDIILDARVYKTWKDKFTLATRFASDLNFGNPPFFDYAFLGGDQYVRGYYYGRYRDEFMSTLQSEFRFPVVWRIGLSAFGGISNLYSKENSFQWKESKFNGGVGLRFLVDKQDRTNLRIDYAIGNEGNNGFYISFGESF